MSETLLEACRQGDLSQVEETHIPDGDSLYQAMLTALDHNQNGVFGWLAEYGIQHLHIGLQAVRCSLEGDQGVLGVLSFHHHYYGVIDDCNQNEYTGTWDPSESGYVQTLVRREWRAYRQGRGSDLPRFFWWWKEMYPEYDLMEDHDFTQLVRKMTTRQG